MPRYLFHVPFSFFIIGNLSAQTAGTAPSGLAINGKWANQIYITDVNGMPIRNHYADVNGVPYFTAEYKFADIKLLSGKLFTKIRTRVDLVAQETHFMSGNGMEAYIETGMVKEVSYADTTATGIVFYKLQTGFPAIDKQTKNNFYLVLAEGKCSFLKAIVKKVSERKSEMSGEVSKELDTYEDYYFFSNGLMKRWKKDREFVLAELADKQVQVNKYLQANKVNFKSEEQVAKLLGYYNSL